MHSIIFSFFKNHFYFNFVYCMEVWLFIYLINYSHYSLFKKSLYWGMTCKIVTILASGVGLLKLLLYPSHMTHKSFKVLFFFWHKIFQTYFIPLCLRDGIIHLSKEPWFLLLEKHVRDQNLSTRGHCGGFIALESF